MNTGKIVSSFGYKFIERLLVKGLGFVISIILARKLTPDVFGQMAILTVFINISLVIVQSGLNTALIQKKEVTDTDYSTVFFISVSIAAFFVVFLFFVTPFIASYYESKLIIWPLRVYSISLLSGAFNSIQVAKMQKELRFREMLFISLIVTVISGIFGIFAAHLGLGIWALIIYYLTSSVLNCFVTFLFCHWLPKFSFSSESAKTLFSYGWKMLVSAILCSLYADIRSLIIGKKYSTENLAYYNRGQQFPELFANTLDTSVQSVMLPVLSAQQDSVVMMRETLRKSITLSSLLVFPAMVGFCVLAEPIVLLLLTDKWSPSIVYIQIISIAEMTMPLISSELIALKATGRSDIYMKLETVRRALMLAVLLLSVWCFDSVFAVTVGFLVSSIIDVITVSVTMKLVLDYGIVDMIKDIWKIFLAAVLMGMIIYIFLQISINMLLRMVLLVVVGVIVYCSLCRLLKIESFVYVETYIKSYLKGKK